MKNLLNISLVLLVLIFASSCEESLTEYNTDPTSATEVGLELLLPEVLASTAFNEGTNPNRVAGIVLQQFVGLDAQQLAYNSYVLGADVMSNYWGLGLYAGVLRSCDVIIEKAAEQGNGGYSGIAKVIMANELGKAAATFGDIPFSEAFNPDILKPQYDSQESVYAAVQTLLDDAIADLAAGGLVRNDLIYNGDLAAWTKVAHAYKARYYLHTSKRNPGDYARAASEAGMAMSSNAENPNFQFEAALTANWSLAKFGIDRPSTLGIDDRFAAMMDGDPRQPVYMFTDGTFWFYFDMATGGNMKWGQSDAAIPLVTHVEMLFIQAEAMAASGGDASSLLESAILSSMELCGVEDGGYASAAAANASWENIMTEAYKAYYGFNFHETWANYRRTGFPALTATPGATNGFNPSGSIPQRYLYADSEDQTNSANVQAARDAQGGALLDAPVWAFE